MVLAADVSLSDPPAPYDMQLAIHVSAQSQVLPLIHVDT